MATKVGHFDFQARPPLPEGRRPLDGNPVAAGAAAGAAVRRSAGVPASDRDHMWEVLHAREKSNSPGLDPRARAVSEVAPGRQVPPGRRLESLSPPPPYGGPPYGGQGGGGEWTPRAQLPRRLPEVGWEVPNAAYPNAHAYAPDLNSDRYELKAPAFLKNDLRHKILGLEAASDQQGWLERKLESSQADQRADLARRWSTFEQADRRFKEWVQREHEEMTSQLQQVKVSSMDGQQQQHRQTTTLANQCQSLELRLQEVESVASQADAKANGLAHAVQVSGAVAGSAGNAGSAAMQGEIEALRNDLDREANARSSQSAESTEKIKELHGLIASVNERQEHEAYGRQQHVTEQSSRAQARVAALEPTFEELRGEVDTLRQLLQRTGGDCARRCEEIETNCLQRVAGVREAALSAARELWEEHKGVLAECKTSMASLQQILETKDKIAAQLQNLTQQQFQDDKEGLLHRLLQGDEALRSRLSEVEAALAGEQSARLEAQHASGAHAGRMGVALEQAQAAWVKESDRISNDLREMRRQVERFADTDSKDWKRQLAEAIHPLQRSIDDLTNRTHSLKTGGGNLEERIAELMRSQEDAIGEAESRLRRQVEDLQAMQAGKLAQCDFDLRAALRATVTENAERARAELARVEEGAMVERNLLRTSIQDIGREAEVRFARLREEFERRLASAEDTASRKAVEVAKLSTQFTKDMTEYHSEARAYADRVGQDARAKAEVELASFVEDMARQAAKNDIATKSYKELQDRTVTDIAREIASVEARLAEAINIVENKASKNFQDGLKLEREHLQTEVEKLLDQERSHRMQAEAERLASLQKRLAAHEELTSRRLEDLKGRQDDAFASHRQSMDALLIQDRKEVTSRFEEMARDHRSSVASTKAELQRLDDAREKLAANLGQGLEDLAATSEDGRAKLEDRMLRELAAFGAKLTVCLTTASAELRHGLKAVDDRLQNGLAAASEKLVAGLAATESAAEAANKALQEALEASISGVGAGLAAHALESAAARASIRSDLNTSTSEVNQKLQELGAACQAFDADLDTRVKVLEEDTPALRRALEQQGTDFTEGLAKASAEAADGLRQMCEDADKTQQVTGERFQQVTDELQVQESAIGNGRTRLDELEAALATAREELTTSLQAGVAGVEEKLLVEISEEQDRRLALTQRLDDLDDAVKEGDERGRAAEAQLQEHIDALQKRSDDSDENLKGLVEVLRSEHDGALGAELTRSTSAEEELQKKIDALAEEQAASKQQLETLRSEREEAFNVESERVTKQLQELDEKQQKQVDECMKELQTQIESKASEQDASAKAMEEKLGGRLQEIDERQLKQTEEVKTEIKTQIESATASQQESSAKAFEEKQKDAESGTKELRDLLERCKADQKKLIEDEEARAKAAEEAIAQRLSTQATSQVSAREELQSKLQGLEQAQAESAKAITKVEGVQEKEIEERAAERKAAEEASKEQAATKELAEKQSSEAAELKTLVEKIEGLLEYRYAEQKGINDESYSKDEELSKQIKAITDKQAEVGASEAAAKVAASDEDAEAIKKLREEVASVKQASEEAKASASEASAKAASAAEESEALAKLRGDVMAVKEGSEKLHSEQTKTNQEQSKINEAVDKAGKERDDKTSGFEEQLGSLLEKCADLVGMVEDKAEKADLLKCRARVEGGFNSMLAHMEAERWLKSNVDGVADGISQSFLGLVDQTCEKLALRVQKIESALSDPGA